MEKELHVFCGMCENQLCWGHLDFIILKSDNALNNAKLKIDELNNLLENRWNKKDGK